MGILGMVSTVSTPNTQWTSTVVVMQAIRVGAMTMADRFLWMASMVNITPAMGALKAAASPAPAPLLIRARFSRLVLFRAFPTPWPVMAPIWTEGPSRPMERPAPMPREVSSSFTRITRAQWVLFSRPSTMPRTWGMPLPPAMGAHRTRAAITMAIRSRAPTHSRV